MGKMLNILGNHRLEFDSGAEAIRIFKERLKVNVHNGWYQSEEVKAQVDDILQIKYFTLYDFLEQNFGRWKQVRIMTNYKYCPEITLFKKVIRFDNGCKHSYWKNCVLNDEFPEDLTRHHEFCRIHWEKVKDYSIQFTTDLGGHKLIYFDDSRFQIQEDVYHEGGSMENLITEMSKVWMPTSFDEIQLRKEESIVRYGWYINEL